MRTLPEGTTIREITLVVNNLESMTRFYAESVGFIVLRSEANRVELGAEERRPFLRLVEDTAALRRPPDAPGLFHAAYVYENRASLGRVFRGLLQKGVRIVGTADHGVSEAVYLADPEGNGIELYADRPRERWPFRNGQLEMLTEPLDVQGLLSAAVHAPDGTGRARIGHLHLQVSSLAAAERWWVDEVGFEVVQRSYPGALFVAAGGYHHHIGLNTWRSLARKLPEGRWTGLRGATIAVPGAGALLSLKERLHTDAQTAEGGVRTEFESTHVQFIETASPIQSSHRQRGET